MSRTIVVTGSRAWTDRETIRAWLARLPRGTVIAHGAAQGADTIADEVARELGLETVPYPVDKHLDGLWPAAGPRRNGRMLRDAEPIRVLAFPTASRENKRSTAITSGTLDCIEQALLLGIAVTICPEDSRP